jgi:mannose-6-phosphate isomerase
VSKPCLDQYLFVGSRIEKPWGYELVWALSDQYCGKILFVRGGESLSLQYHVEKNETIHMQSGRAEVDVGRSVDDLCTAELELGQSLRLEPRTIHRLRAIEDSLFIEVSTPHLADVVRLDDRYGRVPAQLSA